MHIPIKGYPTLVFYPKESKSKKGIQFEGNRDIPEFLTFIQKHSKIPIGQILEDMNSNNNEADDNNTSIVNGSQKD